MANGCYFVMKVLGTAQNLNEFQKRMKDDNERVYDFFVFNECELGNGKSVWSFSGDCAWSIQSAMIENDRNVLDLTKELGLILEVYSQEIGMGFEEYYCIELGEIKAGQSKEFRSYCVEIEGLTPEEVEPIKADAREKNLPIIEEEVGTFTVGGFAAWKFKLDEVIDAFKNITDIILDVYNNEGEDEINIYISFIMTYGFKPAFICRYAEAIGIAIDENDCDPDDPYDCYGALVITPKVVAKIK